jgi:hypothetical protein
MHMPNYLLPILEKYFAEILSIEGKLILSEAFLKERTKQIINEDRQRKELVGAITSYRHLSLINAHENLFTPDYSYDITTDNVDNEIKDVISQQCCFAVSQSYEVFESFLIEILKEYLFYHQELLSGFKFGTNDIPLIREAIKTELKKNDKQGKNNRGLLLMIRKISPFFRQHEIKNAFDVHITRWFDLVSMIRHNLVHNRQIISVGLLKYIEETKTNDMFNRHFQRKVIGNDVCIYLQKDVASDIINWLNCLAHFIFMSLSTEANLSLYVPQFVP